MNSHAWLSGARITAARFDQLDPRDLQLSPAAQQPTPFTFPLLHNVEQPAWKLAQNIPARVSHHSCYHRSSAR